MTAPARDLVGYANRTPTERWLGETDVAVSLVVNYEEGSELAFGNGDVTQEAMTEWGTYPFPSDVRNLAMESMYEYGSRVGVWRILDLLSEYRVKSTFFGCAVAFEKAPAVAARVAADGHEVCSHGWRWEEVFRLTEAEEREHIRRAVESITRTCGQRPVGWYCRYGPSERTRRLLIEEGGFLYDSDSYSDDVPYVVAHKNGEHCVVPYAADTNDIQFWLQDPLAPADHFAQYLIDTFDEMVRSAGTRGPQMMSVGLHCRIIGRPGRLAGLRKFIEHVQGSERGAFMTRRQIAAAFLEGRRADDVPTTPLLAGQAASDESLSSSPPTVGVGNGRPVLRVRTSEARRVDVGNGGFALHYVSAERDPAVTSTLGVSSVPGGCETDMIQHTHEELCLVTEGQGELRTDLGPVKFTAGDALHIPAHRWHAIANTGEGETKMVFFFPTPEYPTTEKR